MKHLIVAWKLREIAELLELLGENNFRRRAFLQAATNLEKLNTDLELIYHEGRLLEIPGVGKSIADLIEEILTGGESSYLLELRARAPYSELLHIPGVGPRMARTIYQSLGIVSIQELKTALDAQKIREIPGMNGRTEGKIASGLRQMSGEDGKYLLGTALPVARELIKRLELVNGVQEIQPVGSVRRFKELVSDVDLLAKTTDAKLLLKVFTSMPECKEVIKVAEGRALILTRHGVRVELITVEPALFATMLFLTTGKEHVRQVEALAVEQGITCGEDAWYEKDGQKLVFATEAQLYHRLGMSYVIPELREGKGEVEAALTGTLPKSVDLQQIRGDLHVHSRWSDGVNSIEEIVNMGKTLGYKYLAICDHSRSLTIGKGMSIELLLEQIKAIDEFNAQTDDFRVFKGIEVDILQDGELDYPDEILGQLDIVVASIHYDFDMTREQMTNRIIKAMRNPYVKIIAHPTGRVIHRFEPCDLDMDQIILVAKETNTVLEINATPERLDICDHYLRLCKKHEVKIAINSDAHSTGQLAHMEYGVGMARRGWLEASDVINTYSLGELRDFLKICD